MADEALGMMDEGYFVSRGDILKWANSLLQLNLTKIEQLGSGSVYCQILDVIFPGQVALNRVNWRAKLEYEFINNLKILQNSFLKLKINRMIEVERLAKAKYQDNLEFAQWLKRFFEMKGGDKGGYDAVGRRGPVEPDFSFAEKTVVPKIFNLATNQEAQRPGPGPSGEKKKPGPRKKSMDNLRTPAHQLVMNKEIPSMKPKPPGKGESSKRVNQEMYLEQLEIIRKIVNDSQLDDSSKVKHISEVLESNSVKIKYVKSNENLKKMEDEEDESL